MNEERRKFEAAHGLATDTSEEFFALYRTETGYTWPPLDLAWQTWRLARVDLVVENAALRDGLAACGKEFYELANVHASARVAIKDLVRFGIDSELFASAMLQLEGAANHSQPLTAPYSLIESLAAHGAGELALDLVREGTDLCLKEFLQRRSDPDDQPKPYAETRAPLASVQFRSAVSGLVYDDPRAAGDIAAVRFNGEWVETGLTDDEAAECVERLEADNQTMQVALVEIRRRYEKWADAHELADEALNSLRSNPEERVKRMTLSTPIVQEELELQATEKMRVAFRIFQRTADQLGEFGIPFIICAADVVPTNNAKGYEVKLVQQSTIGHEKLLEEVLPAIEINAVAMLRNDTRGTVTEDEAERRHE